jgi:hypothetical protein
LRGIRCIDALASALKDAKRALDSRPFCVSGAFDVGRRRLRLMLL